MRRALTEKTLVIATHNAGKLREIRDLLAPFGVDCVSAADLNLPEPEETGKTFEENAVLKARAAAVESNIPALADDSGLAVAALGGEPGIYSARWAGPERDFNLAMKAVHEKLGDNADRRAAFICVLALVWPDGHVESFEGRIDGSLVWPPRGEKGFGYDPMFVAEGFDRTFAEIDPQEKHAVSHRARAFRLLVDECLAGRERSLAG